MKKTNLIKLMTLAMILPLFISSAFGQKSIELKYNLNEGDIYNYVMDLDQDIVFETNGQTMALDMKMTFEMLQKVDEVTSDSIKLEGMIKKVKMSQAIFGMEVKYDSEDPASAENPMVAQMATEFEKLLDKPYYMTMDHRGSLGHMDLSGLSENDELANNINSGSQFAVYKKGKVSVGESWEEDIQPVENSDMKYHLKYTLLKLTGKQATIKFDGVITANEMSDVDLNLNGTMTGEMIVDAKTGWLIESKMDQELSMDIEQNGMKFPATVSGTTLTTSAKVK